MIKENTPVLETKRLVLRKFLELDLPDMQLLYGDREVNRFLPWFPMETRKAVEEYLYNVIFPCYEKEIGYTYAVTAKKERRIIGYLHIHDIGESNDLGYGLRKEFWQQGIMTEACMALADHLRQVGFPFLTATHDRQNPASGRVMEKLGMTYRYSFREQWQPKNIPVVFRLYQLNLDGVDRTFAGYREKHPSFVESIKR